MGIFFPKLKELCRSLLPTAIVLCPQDTCHGPSLAQSISVPIGQSSGIPRPFFQLVIPRRAKQVKLLLRGLGKIGHSEAIVRRITFAPETEGSGPKGDATGKLISLNKGRFCVATDFRAWYGSFPTVASPRCTVSVSHPLARYSILSSVLPIEDSFPRSWAAGSSFAAITFAIVCRAFEVSSKAGGPGSVYAPA